MAKIPLGSSPRPDPADFSISEFQRSASPIPAVPIPAAELANLGLSDPLPKAPLRSSSVRPDNKIAAFVEAVAPAATLAAEQLHVPVEAVISQWALESGWGQSELAKKYNNFGGIKAYGGWKGGSVNMPSYEKNRTVMETSPFRTYPSVEDYGRDFTNFLTRNPRYKSVLGTNNVRSYAMALGRAGYHDDSDDSYSSQLESIARRIRPLLGQ